MNKAVSVTFTVLATVILVPIAVENFKMNGFLHTLQLLAIISASVGVAFGMTLASQKLFGRM